MTLPNPWLGMVSPTSGHSKPSRPSTTKANSIPEVGSCKSNLLPPEPSITPWPNWLSIAQPAFDASAQFYLKKSKFPLPPCNCVRVNAWCNIQQNPSQQALWTGKNVPDGQILSLCSRVAVSLMKRIGCMPCLEWRLFWRGRMETFWQGCGGMNSRWVCFGGPIQTTPIGLL